jgi:hypothetical protein
MGHLVSRPESIAYTHDRGPRGLRVSRKLLCLRKSHAGERARIGPDVLGSAVNRCPPAWPYRRCRRPRPVDPEAHTRTSGPRCGTDTLFGNWFGNCAVGDAYAEPVARNRHFPAATARRRGERSVRGLGRRNRYPVPRNRFVARNGGDRPARDSLLLCAPCVHPAAEIADVSSRRTDGGVCTTVPRNRMPRPLPRSRNLQLTHSISPGNKQNGRRDDQPRVDG